MFSRFVWEQLIVGIVHYLWPLLGMGMMSGLFYWSLVYSGLETGYDLLFWRMLPESANWGNLSLLSWVTLLLLLLCFGYLMGRRPLLRNLWVLYWIMHFSVLNQQIATIVLAVIVGLALVRILWQCRKVEHRRLLKKVLLARWELFLMNFQDVHLLPSHPGELSKHLWRWGMTHTKQWVNHYYKFWQAERGRW
ncbi:MAG: hypothetical protein Q4A55_02320 [Aerococcus sp.]|nr:hypothetical protein [Aerococcus sp.]